MAEDGFFWIYLIFFMIPLARIIPRLFRRFQNKNKFSPQRENVSWSPREGFDQKESLSDFETLDKTETIEKPIEKDMQVLGEINRGVKDFNQIQKNTNVDNGELEEILKKFEDEGLMRVIKKDGVMGSKIELHPTEKGFKRFNK